MLIEEHSLCVQFSMRVQRYLMMWPERWKMSVIIQEFSSNNYFKIYAKYMKVPLSLSVLHQKTSQHVLYEQVMQFKQSKALSC